MTGRAWTKIALGLGGMILLAGISALSLYNHKILASIQPDTAAQTAAPAQTQSQAMPTQPPTVTAKAVVIDPHNDPLAPVKYTNTVSVPAAERAKQDMVTSKTYEVPLKSPVLVQ